MAMKYLLLIVFCLACSSTPKEVKLLEKEQLFLTKLIKRDPLIPASYQLTDLAEKDAVLKGIIHYYPFADAKIVTEQMIQKNIDPTPQNIEAAMKFENDNVIDQMNKLIEAFRVIPQEQMARTQESLDRFSLQIRRRQQSYTAPIKCFNEKDCPANHICLKAGFCSL